MHFWLSCLYRQAKKKIYKVNPNVSITNINKTSLTEIALIFSAAASVYRDLSMERDKGVTITSLI